MVGGKNYSDSPFNRVTQARRQPGSAFKLFVYLAALRAGWTPDSLIEDSPITIGGWTPLNSDRVYRGKITLREAFARSSNAATVRLSEAVGRNNVIRAARDLGITTPLPDKPSLALGTAGDEPARTDLGLCGGRQRPLSDRRPRASRRAAARGLGGLLPARRRARAGGATGRRCSTCSTPRPTTAPGAAPRSPIPTFGKTGTTPGQPRRRCSSALPAI